MSAKQLGADKRVAMWQPDSQVGMVVLVPPPIPKIDHEVPILPPVHPEKDLEVEGDPADLRLSSRRQSPTSSRPVGCGLKGGRED